MENQQHGHWLCAQEPKTFIPSLSLDEMVESGTYEP